MSTIVLAGCDSTRETTPNYVLPSELSDCKIYNVASSDKMSSTLTLTVVRCPLSSTTTMYNGSKTKITLIESDLIKNENANVTNMITGKSYKKFDESNVINIRGIQYVEVDKDKGERPEVTNMVTGKGYKKLDESNVTNIRGVKYVGSSDYRVEIKKIE